MQKEKEQINCNARIITRPKTPICLREQDKSNANGLDTVVFQDVMVCGICSQEFHDIPEFLQHRIQHPHGINADLYRCELCKKAFPFQDSVLSHYKSTHNVAFASLCSENTAPPSNKSNSSEDDNLSGRVDNHSSDQDAVQATHIEILSKTPLQNYKVNSPNDFYFLLQTDIVKGRSLEYKKICFKCLYCDYKTFNKWNLCKHMKDQHNEVIGINQSILMGENLNDDRQKLLSMFIYDAHYGISFPNKPGRKPFKRSKRSDKQDRSGIYPCNICGKVFNRIRYLRKHGQIHLTEKRFACEDCDKRFISKTYLAVHRRSHRDKTFHCVQCDFASTINAAIHAHRQIHNQGSVLCDICGFAYTGKTSLSKHMRVHDSQRPFSCSFPECTWRFKTKAMANAHTRAHTMEGKFKCSLCGYVFRHKHHLIRHEIKVHSLTTKISNELQRSVDIMLNPESQIQMQPELIVVSDCSNGNDLDAIPQICTPYHSVMPMNKKTIFLNTTDNLHDDTQTLGHVLHTIGDVQSNVIHNIVQPESSAPSVQSHMKTLHV